MLNLSRLLLHSSRNHISSKSMLGVAANDFKSLCGVATQAGASTATPKFEPTAKIFAPYSVYKGTALAADPLLPKFTKLESGDYRVERRGVIMLTFWHAIGERKYDWEIRQMNSGGRSSLSKGGKYFQLQRRRFSSKPKHLYTEDDAVPSAGISRPLSDILKDLNKKVPESLLKPSGSGSSLKYIPWHTLNRILNLHAPEWSGEVRSISYSPDSTSVSLVYRVTLYGTDAEIFRESTGTALLSDGGPVQKAEAMAFRRACARLGLGLHLYHEDQE